MKVRFIGPEAEVEAFGAVFKQGEGTDVSSLSEGQQAKLANNPTFAVVATRKKAEAEAEG